VAIEPNFDTRHGIVPFVSSPRREGIPVAGVALTNAAVFAVDEHLAALTNGSLTRGRNGFASSVVDGSCAAVPITLRGPTALMRHNMPIFARHSRLLMPIPIDRLPTMCLFPYQKMVFINP